MKLKHKTPKDCNRYCIIGNRKSLIAPANRKSLQPIVNRKAMHQGWERSHAVAARSEAEGRSVSVVSYSPTRQ